MNPIVRRRIHQLRRRWWVVMLFVGAALASAVPALLLAKPTYVATSTLVLSSPGRNPADDATMAVGYSTLFNEPETIDRLRTSGNLPGNVKFESRTVAASPIVAIKATADNADVAQHASFKMAEAFRDDVNSVRKLGYDSAIEDTKKQLGSLLAGPPLPGGLVNPLVPIAQQRLNTLLSDSTNQLQDLQLIAGVTKVAPNIIVELGIRAIGGLLLGGIAAIALATLSPRIANAEDLLAKNGIEPLVEVPAGGSVAQDKMREERLRTLANSISIQDLPKSAVLAVTDCRNTKGAGELAEALARLTAQQGITTVLVYADNDVAQHREVAGFNDVIAGDDLVYNVLQDDTCDSLKIMRAGSVVADRYSMMNRDRIVAVFDELRSGADIIFVAAPSIADWVEGQPVCAAADCTLVVVAKNASRSGDVTAAVDALNEAHSVLLGAVLIDGTD